MPPHTATHDTLVSLHLDNMADRMEEILDEMTSSDPGYASLAAARVALVQGANEYAAAVKQARAVAAHDKVMGREPSMVDVPDEYPLARALFVAPEPEVT